METHPPVLIVEPVTMFRESLRRVLLEANFETVWCDDRPPTGPIALGGSSEPPILVIGSNASDVAGHIAQVKRYHPGTRVILLLSTISRDEVNAALDWGADTGLHRGSSCDTLIGMLNLLRNGIIVFPSDILTAILADHTGQNKTTTETRQKAEPLKPAPQLSNLSAREFSVLYHLLDGLQNKEIARRLNIAEATIKVHVKAILRKAQVRNRTQIAMWASRQGAQIALPASAEPFKVDILALPDGAGPIDIELLRHAPPRSDGLV